jgi:acetylornithine deacetylase
MPLDLAETLAQLVALPSVNPMGRPTNGPEFYEYRVTEYLERLLTRHGIASHRQPIAPLRENLIARVDGYPAPEVGGALLLFEVHQDTVPVDGMTIEPWNPVIRDGRLYGRGSCDVKGGMAAMLGALVRLAELRKSSFEPRPTVILACTVNEENGFTGATGLSRFWSDLDSPLILRRPDAAIVAEPTNLAIVVAHKGVVRWRCHTHGRAAHSSQPEQGDNAIYRMAAVVTALERYASEVLPTQAEHPLCGRPTLSVGTIAGGTGVNLVPRQATIEIDRRLVPGEQPAQAYQQAIAYVANAVGPAAAAHIEHEPPFIQNAGLSDANNGWLAARLGSAVSAVVGSARTLGVSFGTDAAALSLSGVPSVVFGPGSINQAHTADEWLPLDELQTASEILFRFASRDLEPTTPIR